MRYKFMESFIDHLLVINLNCDSQFSFQ